MSSSSGDQRWREVERLYHAALACQGETRKALLATSDTELCQEVESLLPADEAADGFLNTHTRIRAASETVRPDRLPLQDPRSARRRRHGRGLPRRGPAAGTPGRHQTAR